MLAASPLAAQEPAPAPMPRPALPAAPREDVAGRLQLRYQLGVMERVFEQAVQHGAQMMERTIQAMAPDLFLFSGPARARGFKLDGYGFFFDVEVPAFRRSVAWSFRTLNQGDASIDTALQALRRHVQSMPTGAGRNSLEQALKRIELQVGAPPMAAMAGSTSAATAASTAPAPEPTGGDVSAMTVNQDPNDTYTDEVKRALIDAMLDHSASIPVGPDEWLTIAARGDDAWLAPNDFYEAQTLVLRIKGSDLTAFRAERLTREEARIRVEVHQF
jgi:hypothetical protein